MKRFGISVFALACLFLSACGSDSTKTTAVAPSVTPGPNFNNGAGQYPGQYPQGQYGQYPNGQQGCGQCGCGNGGGNWGGGWSWSWSYGDRQNANLADSYGCGYDDYDDYGDDWY